MRRARWGLTAWCLLAVASTTTAAQPASVPLAGAAELSLDVLVQEVLARNPSLAEMVAAWQAASARFPQVTSLDDPMVEGTIGPETFRPDDPGLEFAYRVAVSQKLPYPGKLRLRGQNALAEASAAGHAVEDMRLQLIESAQDAFYAYYLADRGLAVNEESLRLLQGFREDARVRYRTGAIKSQQEVVQIDVELGRQRERELTQRRMRQVARARLNTLMHLPPDSPLPPAPGQLTRSGVLPDVSRLRALAVAQRPDLRAAADHVAAERAALALACKEFYPDFGPFLMYDRFMGNTTGSRDLATMVGVRLNLPVYRAKRSAAVAEAQARLAQRRAELARLTDQVNFQVQEAYEQVRESEQTLRLYEQSILPNARLSVQEARPAYVTGQIPLLSLLDAQRNLINLLDRYYEATAEYFRRRATLERVSGGPLGSDAPEASAPPGQDTPTNRSRRTIEEE